MPFVSVERLSDEPIFLVRFSGIVTRDDTISAYSATAQLWSDDLVRTGSHVITIVEDNPGDFASIIAVLQVSAEMDVLLHDIMQHVTQYHVSDRSMAQLYANARRLPQFGGREVSMFHTLDDAIAAARQNIASRVQSSNSVSSQLV
jgi:hypothetical protein